MTINNSDKPTDGETIAPMPEERDARDVKYEALQKQLRTIFLDETFPRTSLVDELTIQQLRAQLATADKDRERMDWLEQDCSALVWNDITPGVERATDGKEFFGDTLRDAADAAMQPSPSLDHGATGQSEVKS